MGKAGRIYRWVVISVILQVAVLLFFNNYFLTTRGSVTAVSIDETDNKPKQNIDIKLPKGASGFKVSFDGAYVGYFLNGKLVIYDLRKKKEIKSISGGSDQLDYYKWLPDRNMVIYSLSAPSGQPGRVQLMTHDVDSGIDHDYPKISGIPKGSRTSSVELSPQTNVVYVKIRTSDSQAAVYKYNIMNDLSYVMAIGNNTVIKETSFSDKLVYQDSKNKLFVRDGAKGVTWQFPFKNKMVLLGIASEDKVYTGELDKSGNVIKVSYGNLSVEPDKSWSQVQLKRAVSPEKILVTRNGAVYELSESENCVYNINNNTKLTYSGNFIEMLDDYIVSVDNNEIKLTVVATDGGKLKN